MSSFPMFSDLCFAWNWDYTLILGEIYPLNHNLRKTIDIIQAILKNLLDVLVGLKIKFRTKRFKEGCIWLLQETWAKIDYKKMLNNEILINLIHVQERLINGHS